ncbi:hypothetical protein [Pediococcus ethanolidurans]
MKLLGKSNSSNIKYARLIILLTNSIYITSYNAEHFVSQKFIDKEYTKRTVGSIGNIIPVGIDHYKDVDPTKKIELYKQNNKSETFLESFLKDFENQYINHENMTVKDYSEFIDDREKKIIKETWNCVSQLMR